MVWDFQEQAGIRMEMEKQMLDKLISAPGLIERLVQNGLGSYGSCLRFPDYTCGAFLSVNLNKPFI